ncbi:retrovirus-related Pol polyprotein from type-1 retrotransposable element R1 isoform X2 [Aedes albopictus]
MCESVESLPETARLQKVLSKDHTNGLGTLKKDDGSYTKNTQETLELMMKTHFPGSLPSLSDQTRDDVCFGNSMNGMEMSNFEASELANYIFTCPRIEWALDSFESFKSPGMDGIFPAHLQKCKLTIIPILLTLFKSSFLLRYIPTKWRQVRVVFIPKTNKKDKTSPKSFRPISLTSIFLKLMEKLIDEYIKSDILQDKPLNRAQFAYQTGKSTISALHSLVTKIEKTFDSKELLLATFIDVEGAFDNASFASMKRAMRKRNFSRSLTDWIEQMLSKREISAYLGDSVVKVTAIQGCPQGGVISPLLWSLIVDDLLTKLQHQGFEVVGFADDIVVIVRGKFDNTVFNRMQEALRFTLVWCKNEGLNINPSKTTIVPFTRRRKISISELKLGDVELSLSLDVKFLGVVLDSKLCWHKHVEKQLEKARNAFWGCKRTFGRKWGLKPKMILWIYMAIVKPIITYASIIWWEKTKQVTTQTKLNKLQRLATASLTGAMHSTPSKALDAMLNLLPLHDCIQITAAKSGLSMRRSLNLNDYNLRGHMSILKTYEIDPVYLVNEDYMIKRNFFGHLFCVADVTRQDWETGEPDFRSGSTVFYTDGSKQDNLVGAGIFGPGVNVSLPLGRWPTVFQAEVYAILECADICLKRRYRNANICICSDSKAALNALKSKVYTSKLVLECSKLLQQLSCRNKVNLYWVPGHRGIEGNEKADQLAKQGSSTQFIGPEPFFGLAPSALKMKFKILEEFKIKHNWMNITDSRQSKRFITPDAINTLRLIDLNKNDLSTYTGLITGHCPCKYYLKLIGKLQEDKCRFCKLETETSEHLLCECVALYHKRCRFLERGLMGPQEIWASHPKHVLSFIRNAVPDWDICCEDSHS